MRLGYIGTGTMGNPMAQCLLDAGYALGVHDIRREATTTLCERGADWFDSPSDLAAASDVILTSLPGPAQVEQVMLGAGGVLSAMAPGSAFIDTTTNSPALILRLADHCRELGIDMLDCPVSMRPPNMTIMAGGDRQVFEKYLPVLEAMGRHIFYVGGAGQGCSAKLVTQYLGYSNFIAAAEGVLMAVKAGVDLKVLAEIVPVSAGASRAFQFFPQSVYVRDFPAAGSLDIVAKDLRLACEMARELQTLCRVGDIADDIFKRAQALGLGSLSFPAVVQVMEQMSGVEIRVEPDQAQSEG